jgi:hypothetical protein
MFIVVPFLRFVPYVLHVHQSDVATVWTEQIRKLGAKREWVQEVKNKLISTHVSKPHLMFCGQIARKVSLYNQHKHL